MIKQNIDIEYSRTADLLADSRNIIDSARNKAYMAVNVALVQRNWLLGKRISEENVDEEGHAEYGRNVIQNLSMNLTALYGAGFDFQQPIQISSFL